MKEIKNKIKEFCEKYKIVFGYLFGSYIENDRTLNSDLDIAIYLKEPYRISLAEINSELIKILNRDRVDIVILNKASLFMQFKIIQKGKLVYCSNDLMRIRYETKIMSLYFDRQYYYKRHIAENLKRIAEKGLL
jgi:hypothetical protein